mgnify:CR=1 FL=1
MDYAITTYDPEFCAVFFRVRETWGELSNMAGRFPIVLGGTSILTSEALYQCLRFPSHPEVQASILNQKSPMGAKMKAKVSVSLTRPDWDDVRVEAMRYSVWEKFKQNNEVLRPVLNLTVDRPIVERSRKDAFWGAKVTETPEGARLVGRNVLGKLLMDLRDSYWDLDIPIAPTGSYLLGVRLDRETGEF